MKKKKAIDSDVDFTASYFISNLVIIYLISSPQIQNFLKCVIVLLFRIVSLLNLKPVTHLSLAHTQPIRMKFTTQASHNRGTLGELQWELLSRFFMLVSSSNVIKWWRIVRRMMFSTLLYTYPLHTGEVNLTFIFAPVESVHSLTLDVPCWGVYVHSWYCFWFQTLYFQLISRLDLFYHTC